MLRIFAGSSPPLELTLLATAVALLFGGLVYLFYPAIVAAAEDSTAAAGRIRPQILLHNNNDAAATPSDDDAAATEQPPPLLTLVIPAYDEEERLPRMIQGAFTYLNSCSENKCNTIEKPNCCKALNDLEKLQRRRRPNNNSDDDDSKARSKNKCPIRIEWIVVDDGSRDGTCRVYESCIQRLMTKAAHSTNNSNNHRHRHHQHCWKLISFPQNCGKGAAVRAGMLAARGDFCLMVDADGATDFGPGLESLVERLALRTHTRQPPPPPTTTDHRPPIVLGSRAHLQQQQGLRSFVRTFLTQAFHVCVVIFVGAGQIRDTQCGFKLLPRDAAHHLFQRLHLRRWAFDTELLFLATHLRYPLEEVSVPWREVEGSKLHTGALNLALVSVGMLRDMVCVRLCYTLGLWKMEDDVQQQQQQYLRKSQ